MEDYNRLCFNMSQIDEEDSQMAFLEGAEVSHLTTVTPQSHAADKPNFSLGTPKKTSAFQINLSDTPNQVATPVIVTDTPNSIATAVPNVSSTSAQLSSPKKGQIKTPRSIACPQKKARKPFIMLDNNLENTLLEDTMFDTSYVDSAQINTDLIGQKNVTADEIRCDYEVKLKIMRGDHLEQQSLLLEQITQADEKIAKKDDQISKISQELESTKFNTIELLTKIDFLEKQNQEILHENDLLKNCKESVEHKISELEERSSAEIEKQFALLEQIAHSEVKNDEKDAEMAEIRIKMESADLNIQELLTKINLLEKEKQNILYDSDLLKASKESGEQKIAVLEERLRSETEKQFKLIEQIAQCKVIINEKDAQMAEIRKKLESAECNTQELLTKANYLNKQNQEILKENELLKASQENNKIKTSEMEDRLALEIEKQFLLLQQIAQSKEEKNSEIVQVQQKLLSADSNAQELLMKIDNLEKKNLEILQENALLKGSQEINLLKIAELEKCSTAEIDKQFALLEQIAQSKAENSEIRRKFEMAKERSKIESEEFDEIENGLRKENFELKRDIVRYKCKLNIITEEQACAELGCDLSKFI